MKKLTFWIIPLFLACTLWAQDEKNGVVVLETPAEAIYVNAQDQLSWLEEGTVISSDGAVILYEEGTIKLLNGVEIVEITGQGRQSLSEKIAPDPTEYMLGFGGDFLALVNETARDLSDPYSEAPSWLRGMGDDDPKSTTGSKRGMGDDDPKSTTGSKRGMGDDDPKSTTGSKRGMGDDDPKSTTGSKRGMGDDDPKSTTGSKRGMGDDDLIRVGRKERQLQDENPPIPLGSGKIQKKSDDQAKVSARGNRGMGDDDPKSTTGSKRGMGDDDPKSTTGSKRGMGDDDPKSTTGSKRGMGDGVELTPSGGYPVWGNIAPGIVYFSWPVQENAGSYKLIIHKNDKNKPVLEFEVTGSFYQMNLADHKKFKTGNAYYWDVVTVLEPDMAIAGSNFEYVSGEEKAAALEVLDANPDYEEAGAIQQKLWEAYAYEQAGFLYQANAIYKELRNQHPDNLLIWKMYQRFLDYSYSWKG